MALKGINPSTSVPYIPEFDRGSDNPVTFWIKPRGNVRANKFAALYVKAVKEDRLNQTRTLDDHLSVEADIASFLDMVEKVENVYFSDQYPEYQFEQDGTTLKLWKEVTDKKMLRAIYNEMSNDLYNEITKASSETSLFTDVEKKS